MKNKVFAAVMFVVALMLPALAGCADPGTGKQPTSGAGAQEISPNPVSEADKAEPIRTQLNAQAQDLLPAAIKTRGTLVVGNAPGTAPLSFYAADNKTVVGSDPAFAQLLADALGLKLVLQPTSWADWPLGVSSGKYDVVLSNVTVTEERKERFDFSSYRNDTLGFYARSDNSLTKINGPADVAGKKIIVGTGTNQEKILLNWDAQNKAKGLPAIEFQYYDDDSASELALQSGRADLTFGPNATGAYKAAVTRKTKLLGLVPGGWPVTAEIAVTSKKGAGLVDATTAALNGLIKDGSYQKVLERWGLSSEAITASRSNPPGLPKS
ncbi:ABC transporter substrate-binding protein [Psychromicrobium sp. YIM B11713]|uniref:ABC transporter substrate-binding protein n=1 Tax=Psychromicrobium sp. YIM B11713 TaxID=3145233 RepID=UPI00374EA0D4